VEVMRLLIEYGANVQIVSKSGETALYCAIANGKSEGVKLLLNSGASPLDISAGIPHYQHARILTWSTSQRLFLAVTLSQSCSACGDLRSDYLVSSPYILLNKRRPHFNPDSLTMCDGQITRLLAVRNA
jgi:hypothetical protein